MTPPQDGPGSVLVEIDGLSVTRDRETALQTVSLALGRGGVHAVVGPNGGGKSTLIAALMGSLPFQGSIRFHWRGDARLAVVPQSFGVDRTLPITVRDFLALTRQRRPVCFGVTRATAARVDALLASVGLEGLARRPIGGLSGGEARRVLLAHAVDPPPELLLLDEPSSSLDEAATLRFEEALMALRGKQGTTVVMVSHDPAQVRRLADTTTVLDRTVRAHGPTADVVGAAAAALPWARP